MLSKQKIGERLKALREHNNEKQIDIAELLNVQRQIVSYYETGARMPNVEDLAILAKHFNTSVDYLLGLTNEKSTDTERNAVCKYTGLNGSAIDRLTEETTDAEIADCINFLLYDVEFWSTVDKIIHYKNDLISWNAAAAELIIKTSDIKERELPQEEAIQFYKEIRLLLDEKLRSVDFGYFDVVESFKDCIQRFIKKEKEENRQNEGVLANVGSFLYCEHYIKTIVSEDGTEIIQFTD